MATTPEPCFMCDPEILEEARSTPGFRCATGFPICDAHREELKGNTNPPRDTLVDEGIVPPSFRWPRE
jgi:hypothetical protein